MKDICVWCQKEITNNPSYTFVITSRQLFGLLTRRQSFTFHNRGEVIAWLLHGQKTRKPDEESS